MRQNRSFIRKVSYAVAIVVLLFPLSKLGIPPSRDTSGKEHPGGWLAKIRKDNKLSQANLGEIDPASETMKLATLGMQGVGVFLLWNKANEYKKTEDWTNLSASLEQISKLEPNFIKVWQYQAWNLSYNVSVEFDDYHDRYHWVIRGIDFLKKGVKVNQDNPTLLWDLGWFTSQKIGRADEHVQYRRLFKADDEFHQDAPDRRREDRDNWLVGKEWFQKANDAVDLKGQSLKGKSPLIFYSDVPMAQMNYAEAIQEEGVHGEVAQQAWIKAADDWNHYGQRPILNTDGLRIHLNDLERKREEAARHMAELEQLVGGMRDSIHRANLALLSREEKELLAIPPEKRDPEQQQTAYHVEKKIEITPSILAEHIKRESPEKAREAMRLAHLTNAALEEVDSIERYRQIVNFDYWRTRSKMEQTPAALLARQKLYEAKQAYRREVDLVKSRELYEAGFQQWRIALDEFPAMVEFGSLPEELVDVVVDYKQILDQLDASFPQDFLLREVVESRDQEGKLRGIFTTPLVKPSAGGAQQPNEGRPPEPREDAPQSPSEPKGASPTDGRPPEPKDDAAGSSAASDPATPASAATEAGRPPEPKDESGTKE